jgi:AcrR family transcriptional regulator
MPSAVRPYRGVSAQDRAADRRASLVQACLDLVGEHGPASVTVEAVCLRAGLTKRYFYESFADREAALGTILDGFHDGIERGVLAAIRECAPADRPRTVVELIVSSLEADPRVARLFAEANAVEVLRVKREAAVERYVVLLRELVLPFPDHGEDSRSARDVISRLIVHGTTDTIAAWLRGGFTADRHQLVDSIVTLGMAVATAV